MPMHVDEIFALKSPYTVMTIDEANAGDAV